MEQKRYVLSGYAVWVALLIAIYYGIDGVRIIAWALISLSGVAAVVAGVVLNRPARKAPWILLAAALTCFAAGQLSFLIAAKHQVALPFPSFADVLYLSCYPLIAVGLLMFISWRTPHGDLRSLIDALILTAGLGLLSWTFLIRPHLYDQTLTGLQKTVAIGYPLGDVLVLALLARLLAPGTARARSVQLLTVGAVACLVSDCAYGAIQLHGVFRNGTIIDLGWALFYCAWGAAALHPTMTRLTDPVPRQQVEVSPVRLAVLMLASLIAPVVLLSAVPGGTGTEGDVIAVFSAGALPTGAGPAVGRGGVPPPGARQGAGAAASQPGPGGHDGRVAGRRGGAGRRRRPAPRQVAGRRAARSAGGRHAARRGQRHRPGTRSRQLGSWPRPGSRW